MKNILLTKTVLSVGTSYTITPIENLVKRGCVLGVPIGLIVNHKGGNMTVRKKTAIHGPPLTTSEESGYSISSSDKEFRKGKPIVCYKCGKAGGTLVKVDVQYKHTNC